MSLLERAGNVVVATAHEGVTKRALPSATWIDDQVYAQLQGHAVESVVTQGTAAMLQGAIGRFLPEVAAEAGEQASVRAIGQATGQAMTSALATQATVKAVVSSVSGCAGALGAGAIVNVTVMALDDEEHTRDEYVEEAICGAMAGVAGWFTSAMVGAAAGSVLPVGGTAVGFLAGAAVGIAMNSILKS